MAGNPDFELIVGVDAGASFNVMKQGLADVIKQLNSDPQKIKLEFDMKSGLEGFKDFQKKVVDGMTGLGSVLRFNMEQISDIGKQLDAIAKKDFTAAFDFSGAFKDDQTEKLAAYKLQIKDYVKTINDAAHEISRLSSSDGGLGKVANLGKYFTDLYNVMGGRGHPGMLDELNKVAAKLNLNNGTFAGTEAIGRQARDVASALRELFELANQKGVGSFDLEKLFTVPERPVTVAQGAQSMFASMSDALAQVTTLITRNQQVTEQAISAEAGAVSAASQQYDIHKAAVEAAVEAEKLKGNISGDVKSKLEAEAGAAEKSAEAAVKEARASEDSAKAKARAREEAEQLGEGYYDKANKAMEEYYAREERLLEQEAAKKEQQVNADIARHNAALDKEAAAIEQWEQKEAAALQKLFAAQDAEFDKLSSNATLDLLGAKLDTVRTKMEALGSGTVSMGENFRVLQDSLSVLSNPDASLEQKRTAYDTFNATLKALEAQIKAVSTAEREKAAAEKESVAAAEAENKAAKIKENNLTRAQNLLNKITKAQQEWTKAAKDPATKNAYNDLGEMSKELKGLMDKYREGTLKTEEFEAAVAKLNHRFTESSGAIKNSGNAIKSWFGTGMTQLASRLAYTFGLVQIVMKTVAEIKKMISTAVELDTAMNQLQIVTRASSGDMALYSKQVSQMAKETAQSTKDLIDATTVYARLGYTMNESSQLAKYTAMLQGVGDVEASTAQDALTAIVKAFGKDVSEIESVMDRMVVVGNNFPISVSDIAVGMNNAGSALSAAGNSFEQSVALLTAANTTIQNISMSSTGMRTITARIRKTKVELDELGETVEEAKYQEVMDLLTGKGVSLTENGQYRATYDIIKDIAEIWDQLTSMEQAGIAEQLAGTRQQNIFYSLVNNFDEAQRSMLAMEESTGELQEAYDIYLDSIQAHVKTLKAAFDELSVTFVNSDLAKFGVDFLTNILEMLTGIIDKFGIIKILLGGAGIFAAIKFLPQLLIGPGANGMSALLALLNPATLGVAAGITAISIAAGSLYSQWKKAHPALEELRSDAKKAQEDLSEINSKIEETDEKIRELNKLKANGALSEAQQAELDYLNKQNEAYEQQKVLLEQIAQYRQDAVRASVNQTAATFFSNGGQSTPFSGKTLTGGSQFYDAGSGGLNEAIEEYTNAQKRIDEINEQIARHNRENADDTIENLRLQNELTKANRRASEAGDYLTELQQTLIDWRTELSGATDEKSIETILQINDALNAIASATGGSAKGFDDFKKRLKSLSGTIRSKLLSGLELSKDEAKEFEKWLINAGYSANDAMEYILRYADELRDSEKANNDVGEAIRRNISHLTSFKDEMASVNAALEEYNKALENGEKGDAIASMEDIYKGAMEDFDAGKYDTNRVRAAAALFFTPEQLAAMNYDMEEVARQMRSTFMQTLFDPGDQSDLTAGQRFIKQVMDNAAQFDGVAKVIDNGDGTVAFWYNSIEELADAFGISTAAVAAFLEEWDAYGVEVIQSQKDFDELVRTYYDLVNAGSSARDAIASLIEEMYSDGSDQFQISQVLQNLVNSGAIEGIPELNQFIAETINKLDALGQTEADPEVNVVDNATASAEQIRRNLEAIFSNPITQYLYTSFLGNGLFNFASGTKNAPSGPALVNEVGPELISDDGKAYIANGGKPGFTYLHEGAIVFTADETKKIFRHGYTNIPIRAYANGTDIRSRLISGKTTPAHASGDVQLCPNCRQIYLRLGYTGECPICHVQLRNGQIVKTTATSGIANAISKVTQAVTSGVKPVATTTSNTVTTNFKPTTSGSLNSFSGSSYVGSGGGGGGGAASQSQSAPQKIDWIAVRLNRIQRIIADLNKVASSGFKRLTTRFDAATSEVSKIQEEIKDQQAGYTRYMKEAGNVGLSSSLAQLVRDGTIDIREYDDDTRQKIQEYQEWYEKALDCKSAVEDLHQSIAQLYQDMFENTQTDFENKLSQVEHAANMAQKDLDMVQARGYLESAVFYERLSDSQSKSINLLEVELQELNRRFKEAIDSGEIESESEAWYDMKSAINDVEEAIADANIQLLEYQRTIRQLNWDYFDYAQERFGQLQNEANFLIELMSNDQLFDDRGQFNSFGQATVGARAINFNAYMEQADAYAKELAKVQRELENDPYDTELIARRETLLGLQQQSILSAEAEKNAVKDLVSQGIQLELDALKDLIDTYNDSLDSAKSLYEYQKKIAEKTADVASIQKQLSAYAGDTSEETRARVQKLNSDLEKAQTDLRETEWEQNISDQKKLLDDVYSEYEEFLNERLDNVDALMADMIAGTNANLDDIRLTLRDVSDKVGYTMTGLMESALSGDVSNYNYGFDGLSAVNVTLNNIYDMVSAMARASGAVKAYATGGLVDYTGLAAVHGTAQKPELMLNAVDTQNFLAAAAMLRERFGAGRMTSPVSDIDRGSGGTVIGAINMTIPIDRVQDYNDFVRQLRDDPKFEKLIGSITLDRLNGKSAFNKNRILF